MESDDVTQALFEIGADTLGEAVGFGVGGLAAGPVGAIGGAALGSAASRLALAIKNEFLSRLLSSKEKDRVVTVADMTKAKIEQKLSQGKTPRDDGFFNAHEGKRSTAEEIFEGTLLIAQREYEERKLPLLANLNANIAFSESVTPGIANRLLKIAADLTYQEIIVLKVLGTLLECETGALYPMSTDSQEREYKRGVVGIESIAVATDIINLYRNGLIHSKSVIRDSTDIYPPDLYVGGYGALLFRLMELDGVEDMEHAVTNFLLDSYDRLIIG